MSKSPHHPISPSPSSRVGGVWVAMFAALLLACGLCLGAFYVLVPFVVENQARALQTNIFLGSLAAIGILFGALLAWQGLERARLRATRSVARAFPPAILLLGGFLVTLLLGLGVLALEPLAAVAFPPFHFLASILPPLALIAYAARQLQVTSGLRALVAALSWGALGSTLLALSLEAVIGVIILAGIAVWVGLSPESVLELERLGAQVRALRTVDEQALMQFLLANPLIIVVALAYFAGIVPLIEEAFKTLIIAFADPSRTRARDMVLWGLAAGMGFAMIENAFNTGIALELWAVAMLARIGATVLHATTGIMMARGWYAARIERRWKRLFITYGISVLLHAVWNTLAIGQSVGAVWLMNDLRAWRIESAGAWIMLALTLGLGVLMCGGVGWIVYALQRAREPSSPKIEMEGETNA